MVKNNELQTAKASQQQKEHTKETAKGNKNVRLLAVRALHEVHKDGAYSNIVLHQYIKDETLTDQERRFFTELFYGVLRRQNYLDALIKHFTKKAVNKHPLWIVEILRLGLYQLLYMDRIPVEAATDESVKLAKKLARGLAPLVNGLLRNFLRQKDTITIEHLGKNDLERLSLTYNQPIWIIEELLKDYRREEVEALCDYFNRLPKLTAYINTCKGSDQEILKKLTEAGIAYEMSEYVPHMICIETHKGHLKEAPWVQDGLVSFLDEGSAAIAYGLAPKKGEKILDMCAAPGGKSYVIANLMDDTGTIKACDIYEHKVTLLKENMKRYGLTSVKACLQDGLALPKNEEGMYDRVLLDAPCSGFGILQRKLDMRWKNRKEEIKELPTLQKALLEEAAKAVKKGGYLLYSTCTIRKAENEKVVEAFLEKHPEFTLMPLDESVPFKNEKKTSMLTINPLNFETGGFFMAFLKKGEL